MKTKLWLSLIVMVIALSSAPFIARAGSLSELEAAVATHHAAGAISDSDVHQMLVDLVDQAQAAPDSAAEAALRGSFIDVCTAFDGVGITSEAASALIAIAQP